MEYCKAQEIVSCLVDAGHTKLAKTIAYHMKPGLVDALLHKHAKQIEQELKRMGFKTKYSDFEDALLETFVGKAEKVTRT